MVEVIPEGVQFGGGTPSVQTHMCSTDQAHHQYGGGTSSVWMRVCSIDLSHPRAGGTSVCGHTGTCRLSRSTFWPKIF